MDAYRLYLRLTQSVREPSFLVGAIGAAYPGAEVVSVALTGADTAVALVRFRKGVPPLRPGDTMAPVTHGLELLGEAAPLAILERAEPVRVAPPGPLSIRGWRQEVSAIERADVGRLALALVMLGTTAWLIRRIKVPARKEGHADARAA